MYIQEVVKKINKLESRQEMVHKLEISEAMISTWMQKANDFCPRLPVAQRIYKHYGYVTYPYSEEAVSGKL